MNKKETEMQITCSKCGNSHEYNLKKIKSLREKLKISQSELARGIGIPQQTISRIERGIGDPSFYKVISILNFLFTEKQRRDINTDGIHYLGLKEEEGFDYTAVQIKGKTIKNVCVEMYYVECDDQGVYVIKETRNKDGTINKKKDVILDFPINLLEEVIIREFDFPHHKSKEVVYRIEIDGEEYLNTIAEVRQLIQKRVIKQPFSSKYGFKFRDYIRIALMSQKKKLEIKEN